MKRFFIQLICWTILSLPAVAQQAKFTATSNAKQVLEGGYFDVSFTLENTQGTQFRPPNFKNFTVAGGPSSSTQTSIVNGRMSSKMSFAYSLVAPKVGNFTIGSASINVNGKIIRTQPLKIQVIKGKPKTAGGASDAREIFVQLELSDSTVYIGQQITAKYMLYTTKDVSSVDFQTEPDYEGFFAKRVRNLSGRAERVIIDGVQYTRKSLRTMAIFPQQTGKFTIEPVYLKLGLPTKDGRRSSFFFQRTTPYQTQTESVTIDVESTPANAPSSFSGAIGKYSMSASVDKTSMTTDGAVTMTMQIRGVGDGKFVQAPQQVNDAFDIYDPNVLRDESLEQGDEIRVDKVFEYLMVPKEPGQHLVQPEFSYYDVDSNAYVTLYARKYRINVVQGSGASRAELIDKDNLDQLRDYVFTNTSLSKETSYFFGSPIHLALLGLPIFSVLGLVFFKRKELEEAAIDPKLKRQSAARKIALSRLEEANGEKEKGNHKEFFAEINKSVYGYIADKYVVQHANLDKAYISNLLSTKANRPDQVPLFEEIIDACQMAMYAGASTDKVDQIYQKSIDFISSLEEG